MPVTDMEFVSFVLYGTAGKDISGKRASSHVENAGAKDMADAYVSKNEEMMKNYEHGVMYGIAFAIETLFPHLNEDIHNILIGFIVRKYEE